MTNEEVLKVLKFHNLCCRLKTMVRSGWKVWCVEAERVESIAEHIFGTCMLAVGILSVNKQLNLNENKIVTMMALHECEEIFIGDITPYETEKVKTKAQKGYEAVEELFKEFDLPNNFRELIAEFEAQATPEAKFAKMVDKLEADIMAYVYEDNINYQKINPEIYKTEIIANSISKGGKCVGDYFANSDEDKYDEVFKQILNGVKQYYKKK